MARSRTAGRSLHQALARGFARHVTPARAVLLALAGALAAFWLANRRREPALRAQTAARLRPLAQEQRA